MTSSEYQGPTFYVGINCDRAGCPRHLEGDVQAFTQAAAEDGLRVELRGKGWRCDKSGDWCPDHLRTPSEPGTPAPEAVAARAKGRGEPVVGGIDPVTRSMWNGTRWVAEPTTPAAVAALRQIDAIIGNAETLGAEELGRVRGIVLDILGAWHAEREAPPRLVDRDAGLWA